MATTSETATPAELASKLILQSPPGQINDCYQDLHGILQDEKTLTEGVKPALKHYNLEQYLVTELPGSQQPVLLCKAAQLDDTERYLDPKSKQSFEFDHLQLTASDLQPIHVWGSLEDTRSALQEAATAYAQEHYSQGVAAVFSTSAPPQPSQLSQHEQQPATDPEAGVNDSEPQPTEDATQSASQEGGLEQEATEQQEQAPEGEEKDTETSATVPEGQETQAATSEAQAAPVQDIAEPTEHKFTLFFVGNRYNPSNFWAGRWRSSFQYDQDTGKITGTVAVHVHYYEQGNVQLHTSREMEQTIAPGTSSATAKEVLKRISEFERSYQMALNEAYADLQDTTFKDLRRALPVTKQKLDWNRITSYKLKGELQK